MISDDAFRQTLAHTRTPCGLTLLIRILFAVQFPMRDLQAVLRAPYFWAHLDITLENIDESQHFWTGTRSCGTSVFVSKTK